MFYDWWDINKKLYFDEVVSEIQMDDAEKQEYCNEINAELYCYLQISEKYEQFPPAEKLEEEISDRQTNCPNYISDIRIVKVHLTTTYDVDIYHTAFVYLIDGEGWRVIRIEDDPKEEWEKKITSIADMGRSVWTSSLDLVNEFIFSNIFVY